MDNNMNDLMKIHSIAKEELNKRFSLDPVNLKHPFPERPIRALGLMKIDGEVFSSEKILRIVFIRPQLPFYFAVRSMFIRPRVEFDMPVFAAEVMKTGSKIMLLTDIHRTGKTHHDDSELFDKMMSIRDRYPDLTKYTKVQNDKIQEVFSPGVFQVVIPEELQEQAVNVYMEYLLLFCDLIENSEPLSGNDLTRTQNAFEDYLEQIIDHDPGLKVWKILFGEKGGIERSLDMHYGR